MIKHSMLWNNTKYEDRILNKRAVKNLQVTKQTEDNMEWVSV